MTESRLDKMKRSNHNTVAGQCVTPSEAIEVEDIPEYKVKEVLDSWLKKENWNILWNGLDTLMIITPGNLNQTLPTPKKWSMTFISQTPLPCANDVQTFLKAWYLNPLKTYVTLWIFSLTWKSKPKKGIVLRIDFPFFQFSILSNLVILSYLRLLQCLALCMIL